MDDAMPRPRVVLPTRVVGACAQLVAKALERRPCHVADTWHIDVVAVELPAHLVCDGHGDGMGMVRGWGWVWVWVWG